MQITCEWFVIINPAAENGRIKTDWTEIESLLRNNNFNFEPAFTRHKYHAVELTVDAVNRGFRKIIVVGGDGTLHEVVNGLFIQSVVTVSEITIGVIPALSVHRHTLLKSIPSEYPAAIEMIAAGYFSFLDIIKVSYHKASYRQSRYFITSARIGIDANIVKRMTYLREEGRYGMLRQWVEAVRLIFDFNKPKVRILASEKELKFNDFTSAIIRIHRSASMCTDKRIIEIATLGNIGRWLLLINIKRLRNGRLYNMKSAIRHYGDTIRIESDDTISLSSDGEMLGYSPVDFSMAEQKIKIIFPRKFSQHSPDRTEISS